MKPIRQSARAAARRLWLRRNGSAFADKSHRRKPRILVDVSIIIRHDAATGIQRVVRSVWTHLRTLDQDEFEIVPVYAGQTHGYCFAPPDFLSRRAAKLDRVPVGVRPGDRFLGLDLAAHYFPHYTDQVRRWKSEGATIHMVVYDLLPLTRPDWFEPSTSANFRAWIDAVLDLADQALCISDRVRDEVRVLLEQTSHDRSVRLGRLHLSGDIAASAPSSGLSDAVHAVLRGLAAHKTILMVGTVEPRKGYDRALDAFEHLWSRDPDGPSLVIVGKAGWKTSGLQGRLRHHVERDRRLFWLEEVSDEALTRLYDQCTAVFIASRAEGFGLPVAEATMHEKWALVRDLPVFREQRLPNLLYFQDDSDAALADSIAELIDRAEEGAPPRVELQSWDSSVRALLGELEFEPARDYGSQSAVVGSR